MAFADGTLYLLQCRAVTAGHSPEPGPGTGPMAGDPVEALQRCLSSPISTRAKLRNRAPVQGAPLLRRRNGRHGRLGRRCILPDRTPERPRFHPRCRALNAPAGDYFGEIALIDEGPRLATITATSELVCFGLTFWEFRPLVQETARLAGSYCSRWPRSSVTPSRTDPTASAGRRPGASGANLERAERRPHSQRHKTGRTTRGSAIASRRAELGDTAVVSVVARCSRFAKLMIGPGRCRDPTRCGQKSLAGGSRRRSTVRSSAKSRGPLALSAEHPCQTATDGIARTAFKDLAGTLTLVGVVLLASVVLVVVELAIRSTGLQVT